jgi:hypothetical protein
MNNYTKRTSEQRSVIALKGCSGEAILRAGVCPCVWLLHNDVPAYSVDLSQNSQNIIIMVVQVTIHHLHNRKASYLW